MAIPALVFHGTWIPRDPEGCFFVWAEDATRLARGRRPKAQKTIPRHPFQAPEAEIAVIVPAGVEMTRVAYLPSLRDTGPIPSLDLGGPSVAAPDDTLELLPWTIRGLSLPPADTAAWLADLTDRPYPPYYGLGADLRYWGQLARFLLELLARERFVPSVSGDRPEAVWRLVLTDAFDRERFSALVDALPPISRALFPPRANMPPHQPPDARALVSDFLGVTAERLIRQWLAGPGSGERALRGRLLPAAQEWLAALAAPMPWLLARDHEIETLRQAVQRWSAPVLREQAPGGFRTCLRLEPPQAEDLEDQPWTLSLLLQANDDPSLLVPAQQVWRERSDTLRYLNRRFDRPQERLLGDLGTAVRLFPPLERVLQKSHPDACPLNLPEAYQFLKEGALLLRESGFGVQLPSAWDEDNRLGVRLRVRTASGPRPGRSGQAGLGLQDLVEVNWEMALGDQPLTREELERLAKLKVPLVRIRGRWTEVDPERLKDALQHLERKADRLTLGSVLRLAADPGEVAPGLPVLDLRAEGEVADLIGKLQGEARLEELQEPGLFQGKLRPYQVRGFSWLAFLRKYGFGACLADDMGLGKTIQVIALLLHERTIDPDTGPTLLVCPASVVGNWQRELARFAPDLQVLVHHGNDRVRGQNLAATARGHDVVISTYALIPRDFADLSRIDWAGIVLDEAQNIKNSGTRQSQSVRSLAAGYRITLTGTPVENRLGELWSILDFLNPGYLGSAAEFHDRYAVPIERYRDAAAGQRLRRLVQLFVLRRVKTDPAIIQDLPEKQEMRVFVNLTPEQATLYEAVVQEMLSQIEESEGIQRRGLVLATLAKLKQVCNHPAQFLGDGSPLPARSGKLERLVEMLEEVLAEGDRALVFTQFAEMGTLIQRHLSDTLGCEVLFLHGGVPQTARSRMVERFQQSEGGPPVFILSLKAGGVGLNLTRANHVFHFDRWWNPAVENQATDRAFRIGQTKQVMVHKFICAGTVEDKIDAMIEAKRELAEMVVSTGESWLTELSTDQIRSLFRLEKE